MIAYNKCLLPEFVWTTQDFDFFLEQKGEAGKFWRLVYGYYSMENKTLLMHLNDIQKLIVLAKLHKYPAGTLNLEGNLAPFGPVHINTIELSPSEMLFGRIACKRIGIECAFIDKLRLTAYNRSGNNWNTTIYDIDYIERQIDFNVPFDIDLSPKQNSDLIIERINRGDYYDWLQITDSFNRDTIDFLLSIINDKDCKKLILRDINHQIQDSLFLTASS